VDSRRVVVSAAALGLFAMGTVAAIVWPASGASSILPAVVLLATCAALAGLALWLAQARGESDARAEVLEEQIQRLEDDSRALGAELEELRTSDPVTGVLNRRAFLKKLSETIRRDRRLERPLVVLLIEVDQFRRINDRLGRLAGDEVLRKTAAALRGVTRGTDFVGRIGGSEFGVVLAECENPDPAIQRLVSALEHQSVGRDEVLPLVVSVGAAIARSAPSGVDLADFIQLAEQSLYTVRGVPWGVQVSVLEPRADRHRQRAGRA